MLCRLPLAKGQIATRRREGRSKLVVNGDGPSKVICVFPFLESMGKLEAAPLEKFNPIKPLRLLRKRDTIVKIMVLLSCGLFCLPLKMLTFYLRF